MNFANDRHALYVGWVVGIARQSGVPAVPIVDDNGDYTDRIEVMLEAGVMIELVVPEPPAEWAL